MSEQSSIGVNFQYSTDDISYTTLGCVLEINGANIEKDIKEGTCLSQTNRWKTFFGAFVDGGESQLKIKYAKAKKTTLLGWVDDQEPMYFRIVVPDGADLSDASTCSRFKSLGLVKSLGLDFPSDGDKVAIPVTIQWSGQPTFTEAA